MDLLKRPRRLRKSKQIRDMVREITVTKDDLIMPVFVKEGIQNKEAIPTMPGIYRHSDASIIDHCKEIFNAGIPGCALFGSIPDSKKNKIASEATNQNNHYIHTIKNIKKHVPELVVITDIALDPYSSDGHDGIVENGNILNDKTVEILSKMAVLHAQAGADIVAPSDMMDGRIKELRHVLDLNNFKDVNILSYSAKYASHFYSPFRDALDSAPKEGDKKTYQMDYSNRKEAVKEALLDEEEGADILMIKPASMYLDIISDIKSNTCLPVAAYHVSGEYAMLKQASENNLLIYENALVEILTSIKRAGADIIITYSALDFTKL